ncbi:MAG: KEOPS complex subunit Pcc1 [Candidatus Woesearchaeota archaeon]
MKAKVSLNLTNLKQQEKQNLLKLFELEDKIFSGERASYEIKSNDKDLFFDITAKDMVALRVCLSAITKILSIYERTEKLIEEEQE